MMVVKMGRGGRDRGQSSGGLAREAFIELFIKLQRYSFMFSYLVHEPLFKLKFGMIFFELIGRSLAK